MGRPQSQSGHGGEEKNSQPPPQIKFKPSTFRMQPKCITDESSLWCKKSIHTETLAPQYRILLAQLVVTTIT
jgi:hypothetical protein